MSSTHFNKTTTTYIINSLFYYGILYIKTGFILITKLILNICICC